MTVIEMSGGVLVEVYSDRLDDDIMLLDWDDYRDDEENYTPAPVRSMAIEEMPEETRAFFQM